MDCRVFAATESRTYSTSTWEWWTPLLLWRTLLFDKRGNAKIKTVLFKFIDRIHQNLSLDASNGARQKVLTTRIYWKKSFLSTESDTKILQSIYFTYKVGIISSYSNRTRIYCACAKLDCRDTRRLHYSALSWLQGWRRAEALSPLTYQKGATGRRCLFIAVSYCR